MPEPRPIPPLSGDGALDVSSIPVLAALLDTDGLDNPSSFEWLASTMACVCRALDAPPEITAALVAGIERSEMSRAVGVLSALQALDAGVVGRQAGEALERRRGDRPADLDMARVGGLKVAEALSLRHDDLEMLAIRLVRTGDCDQAALAVVEHAETGGALVLGQLSGGLEDAPGEALEHGLRGLGARAPGLMAGDKEPVVETLAIAELERRLRSAALQTARLGFDVPFELGVLLPVLARALTGRPDGLPTLASAPPGAYDGHDGGAGAETVSSH